MSAWSYRRPFLFFATVHDIMLLWHRWAFKTLLILNLSPATIGKSTSSGVNHSAPLASDAKQITVAMQ